jgi:hypothetical protein
MTLCSWRIFHYCHLRQCRSGQFVGIGVEESKERPRLYQHCAFMTSGTTP